MEVLFQQLLSLAVNPFAEQIWDSAFNIWFEIWPSLHCEMQAWSLHLRGQNLANAVSELLHPEHGTLPLHLCSQTITRQQFQSGLKTHLFKRALHMTFTSENYWGVNLLTYLLTSVLRWCLRCRKAADSWNRVDAHREDESRDQSRDTLAWQRGCRQRVRLHLASVYRDGPSPSTPPPSPTAAAKRIAASRTAETRRRLV